MKIRPKLRFEWRTLLMASILGILGLLYSGVLNAQAPDVIARDAWVRVPLPSKTETALYLVLENHSSQRRALVSVSSDSAAQAEMHQMTMVRTMMVMTPVSQVAIPARGKTSFNPDGLHIMLYGLKTRPAPGEKIEVTLKFDDGTTLPVEAIVRK